MALSPSSYALSNRVDLYRFTGAQDLDGGVAPGPYGSAFATAVPCSVQPDDPLRDFDPTTGRIVEKMPWNVFFATDYALRADDKIVWADDAGTVRTLFVFGTANEAGKGGTFTVHAEERR